MESWQAELKLRIPGMPWKIRVGFTFEWNAWLIAYDVAKLSPEQFNELPKEEQFNLLAYGAAWWHRIKYGRPVHFSKEELTEALLRASMQDNLRLTVAISHSQWPKWLTEWIPDMSKE